MQKLINRRVLISMLFIGLTMMGVFSYRFLDMELYPNAELQTLYVTARSQIELDPDYVENEAAIPLESIISGMEGVEDIETRVSSQMVRITISYNQSVDIKYAYLKLEAQIKSQADDIMDEFTVNVSKAGAGNASDMFMTLQILGDDNIDYVRNITDLDIAPILESVDGVATVSVMGGREKSIEVIVDQDKCEALNITLSQITNLISSNMSENEYLGNVYRNKKQYLVNLKAEYVDVSDLENIVVSTKGPILLKDIAEVNFGIKKEESYSRINGKEVITCIVSKSSQVNVIDLSERIREELEKLNAELESKGVNIRVDSDSAELMSDNIDMVINLGLFGAVLAIFILYLFLRNLKIVTLIAFAIPISVFSAFYFFYFYDISINILTLTGIALAIGMLLDNSVVVMENIFRLRTLGKSSEEASVQGVKEVAKAIVAATLTTITVFLPFLFSDDYLLKLIGEHVGISIITTLIVSLVVALLLIPMAVHYFMLRQNKIVDLSSLSTHNRAMQIYMALLKLCLRRPMAVIFSSIVLLGLTIFLTVTLSLNTLQDVKANSFDVYMTFSSGNTLDKTDEYIRDFEQLLNDVPEIEQYSSSVYDVDAKMTINLKEDYEEMNSKTMEQLKAEIISIARRVRITNISLEAFESSENFQGSGSGGMMNGATSLLSKMGVGTQRERIVIKGQDYESMSNLAELLAYQIEELDNISYSNASMSRGNPESKLIFDQYQMEVLGVTPLNVVRELENFRPENTSTTQYKTDEQDYDIIIKDKELVEKEQTDPDNTNSTRSLDDLRLLQVENSEGATIEIRRFSKINLTTGQGNIIRYNQDKEINVYYTFNTEINESKSILEEAREEIVQLVQNTDIPAGLAVEIIHEENETSEFTFLILAAFLIIYMILASVFESLTAPVVLMFAIPLAAIGSLIALLLTNNSWMNANVLIGLIILIGIVVNNSIILIDYTEQLRKQGFSRARALIVSGVSRLRPILITAITTIVAMLPLAMGRGEYVSGLGAPFAVTVVGGLITSTFLTLIVIPTLYSGLEEAIKRFRTQSILMKVIQISLLTIGCVLIYFTESNLVYRICYLIGALILIPSVTWFIETSLRQANADIVARDEDVHISIRNLVKIYGRPSEFEREWNSGKNVVAHNEGEQTSSLTHLLWMLPVVVFLVYFATIYQESSFWAILGGMAIWGMLLRMFKILRDNVVGSERLTKVINICEKITIYLLPLFILLFMTRKFGGRGLTTLLGTTWYIFILGAYLSRYVQHKNIDITQIEGRAREIKRFIFTMSQRLPFVGKKSESFKALSSVSLEIHTGMFGLLGPNGAGKTTLMRVICGIFEQSYGKIFINGIDTQEKREELQGLIGYLPQEFGTYENLTAWDYLDYQALLKGIYNTKVRKQRIHDVLDAVHMWENKDKKIGGFSGGMKQRVGIAQTLLNLPRILVVDEPTAGLDPRERIRFRNLLVELSRKRIVIFSTHIIEDIASSCNQVGIINKGQLKFSGHPNDMLEVAKDVTWTFEIDPREFTQLSSELLLVHHIRKGDVIKVRCLSVNQPHPEAVKIQPLLEDAYLWLLRGIKIENKEEIITH